MTTNSEKNNSEPSSSREYLARARRVFLKAAGMAGLLASIPSSLKAFFMNTLGVRTVEKDSFVFRKDLIFWKNSKKQEPYHFFVGGLAKNKIKLSYSKLLKLPQISQTSDFHCVEGWSVKDIVWGGIRFEEIVKIAQPAPEAKYAIFHSLGETEHAPQGQSNYIECLPLQHLLDPHKECLLALTMNGKPLAHDHGAPMRVIAPFDLGYKSIKFVYKVDFAREEKPGWWTLANPIYPMNAPVPASRLRRK